MRSSQLYIQFWDLSFFFKKNLEVCLYDFCSKMEKKYCYILIITAKQGYLLGRMR